MAYGAGMNKFCSTCHPDMHTDSGGLVHTTDANMGSTIAGIYNDYVGSGDLSGDVSTAYDSLIPFQNDNSTGLGFRILTGFPTRYFVRLDPN